MKKVQNPNKLRSALFRVLSYFALGADVGEHMLPFWDHLTTGRLGGREGFFFDRHKQYLKSVKNRRRTNRN